MEINVVLEWFKFADHDFDAAELFLEMRPQHYEIVCYHCEQSAEKYLKGYLVHRCIIPPKTHELGTLCKMCSKFDERFDIISNECESLTQYGVQPRYPSEMELSDYHVKKAVTYARTIKNFGPIIEVLNLLEHNISDEINQQNLRQ
jgi:HEPN domain-containing protein